MQYFIRKPRPWHVVHLGTGTLITVPAISPEDALIEAAHLHPEFRPDLGEAIVFQDITAGYGLLSTNRDGSDLTNVAEEWATWLETVSR